MDLSLLGWIVVGFLAGWLSGMVVPGRSARGCLPNILVGVLGGLLGGYLAREAHLGVPGELIGAIFVAFVGAVIVRLIISAVAGDGGRRL
jgi:uncharacterized membrane protein YeaQ/YmgE (transglycosylase-associated protein family)